MADIADASTRVDARSPRGKATTPALLVVLSFLIFAVLWELAIRLLAVPAYILPRPTDVVAFAYRDLASGVILRHFWVTLSEVVLGFLAASAAGIAIGTAIGLMPALNRMLYPLILAFQTIPKIALAPLFLIWFGFGLQSKVITVAAIVFFPILVNVIAGLATVDRRRLLLMRALRASPMKTYWKVRFPSMLPFLFAGLEVAIVFSVTGAIVAEFIGASSGLGALIIQRQATSDVAGVFSVLTYLTFMGLALHGLLKLVSRRFVRWAETEPG